MKFEIISSLVCGTLTFLNLYVLDVRAEVYPKIRQSSTLASRVARAEHVERDLSSVNSIKSAASELKVFRRAHWTSDEEQHLLNLRNQQQKSWDEINEIFQQRTWQALVAKYYRLTGDLSTTDKPPKNSPWTYKEDKLLMELVKASTPWEQIAKKLPRRTEKAVRSRYYYLTKDKSVPKVIYRPWTAEEDKLVVELVEAGVPLKERVKFFNDRTVEALEQRSKKLVPSPLRFSSEEDDLIIKALDSGMVTKEISQLLDRTTRAVNKRIKRLEQSNRIKPAPQIANNRRFTVADFKLMDEMVEKDMSWEDIATEYFPGRSPKRMKSSFKRYEEQKQRGETKE